MSVRPLHQCQAFTDRGQRCAWPAREVLATPIGDLAFCNAHVRSYLAGKQMTAAIARGNTKAVRHER